MIKHVKTVKSASPHEVLGLLSALADETRQEIIMVFAHSKELCANDIAENFSLSRPTVSHHLNLMKRIGILNSRKSGKEIYYSFNKSYVTGALRSLIKILEKCC